MRKVIARCFAHFLTMAILAVFSIMTSADDKAEQARVAIAYGGWAAIKRQHLDPKAQDDKWISMRNISTKDDGQIITIMDRDQPTPYSLELIVITYEQTNTTVLKLALYEKGKDKSIAYIWGEPGAGRLGLNLRWMQTGFTREDSVKTD